MTTNCYFVKVDLCFAYRSIRINAASQRVTGFKWNCNKEIYLKGTKLPFGAKLSPAIFHRLTHAGKRMMARRGFDLLVVYFDDFLIIAKSKDTCAQTLNILSQLLRKLGFAIHWEKVKDPTHVITFLRIELDSTAMAL